MNIKEYRATPEWPYHVSSGGLVFRSGRSGIEYALLYRGERFGNKGTSWHLPKGTLQAGENLEECAVREIEEESGLKSEIVGYLGAKHWEWTDDEGMFRDKVSHYYLCRYLDGDGSAMDHEHDSLEWHTAESAKEKLSQESRKREDILIERAEEFLRKFGETD